MSWYNKRGSCWSQIQIIDIIWMFILHEILLPHVYNGIVSASYIFAVLNLHWIIL